jgi:Repeat of unknown function (DUF5907)
MPTLAAALDFVKLEARNIRHHQLGTAPAAPVTGQMYYNTGDNTLYWWDGSIWVSARGGAASTPDATTSSKGVIQLAGDLAGTAAAPQIAAGVIVDADINASNKDGAAGTPSLRTLGTGAQQAAAGNDTRFTDARAPTAHAATHQPGGGDAMAVDAVVGTGSLRTLGAGAQQAMPGNRTLDAITVPGASVNVNSQKIINLADPTGNTDAANKQYVDNNIQGLDAKASVKAASTANLTLSGTQTVDGIALVANDRVLVKDQSTPANNGIYLVQAGAWTRATDMDAWAEVPSAYVWVEQGTTQADTGWVATADQGGTLNSTAITWTQFSSAGAAIAGAGLTKTGNTIDAVGTANRILVNADNIDIHGSYVGQASITTLGTVTTGVWNGTAVPVANGGTGQATAKAGRETGLAAAGYYSSATHGAGTSISITQATHGLRASRGLLVQVQDEASGNVEIPDISVAASGDVTVTFGASVTANSKRVTVIG